MTYLHRPRVILAVLIAVLLMSLAVPGADARLPRARPYRVGGPITLDTNLLSVSGVSAWAIDAYLKATTSLPPLGAAFLAAERKYGINARFLLAAALHESGWGTSYIARVKHNLFGYNAYDRDPVRYASAYETYAANIDDTAKYIKAWYLTPGGRWWGGRPTLRSMQQFWSSSHRWGVSVSRIATSIHLASLAGRSITFAAPLVKGPLHGGDQASVDLTWTGGAIPSGVEFVATWEAIELDSDVIAATTSRPATGDAGAFEAAPPPNASPSPSPAAPTTNAPDPSRPTSVAARRVRTGTGSIGLAVAAPGKPGSYLLDVEMRDSGRGPLPTAERVDIPSVEVRVWGDRAVSYDFEPSPDGTGAIVRITNTGRTPIPAGPNQTSPASRDPEALAARSVVTVTASAGDPGSPAEVLLIATPLVADLLPGASLSIDVPRIDAATGRRTNWLSVSLSVLGDATWLGAYPPVGAWFSDAELGIPVDPAVPTPTPVPSPTRTPVPSPTPIPVPTSSATPAPAPVTASYSEHSGSIAYRGSWGNAPYGGYIGGNVAWSKTPGSTATFTFSGSSVSWIGPVGPTRGLALVLLDGQAVTRVDLWRSSFVARAVLFKRSFGSVGRHTLTIEVLSMPSHPYVAIDGFVVVS